MWKNKTHNHQHPDDDAVFTSDADKGAGDGTAATAQASRSQVESKLREEYALKLDTAGGGGGGGGDGVSGAESAIVDAFVTETKPKRKRDKYQINPKVEGRTVCIQAPAKEEGEEMQALKGTGDNDGDDDNVSEDAAKP